MRRPTGRAKSNGAGRPAHGRLDLGDGSDDKQTVGSIICWNPQPRTMAVARLLLGLAAAGAGCAGSASSTEPPQPSGRAQRALVQVCAEACYTKDQNRAVQADVIRRQCETACRSQLEWPLVSDRDDVQDRVGRYVRLQGLLTEKAGQPALQLSDGIVIMLRVDPDTAGDLPFQGLVAASGRLEADNSLTTHNVVALP